MTKCDERGCLGCVACDGSGAGQTPAVDWELGETWDARKMIDVWRDHAAEDGHGTTVPVCFETMHRDVHSMLAMLQDAQNKYSVAIESKADALIALADRKLVVSRTLLEELDNHRRACAGNVPFRVNRLLDAVADPLTVLVPWEGIHEGLVNVLKHIERGDTKISDLGPEGTVKSIMAGIG